MTATDSNEVRAAVLESLQQVAPEIDPSTIRDDDDLRDELDLDSMDFLGFVTAVHDRLGIDIPESDYSRLGTLADATSYLTDKLRSES